MAEYEPPVSRLIDIGRPDTRREWDDYSAYGLGPEHIPELIRLLRDEDLAWADSDQPSVYAQVHAWRALAALRAEAAIEPMLDLLAEQDHDDDGDWNDWVTEEIPVALGVIGPAAFPGAADRLQKSGTSHWPTVYFARALAEIGIRFPEMRADAIDQLCRVLDRAAENDAGLNGLVIGDLLDLKAVEAWPAIERAFATDNVEEWIAGDAAEVKWELGLGPQPPRERPPLINHSSGGFRTPKERAEHRARKRKSEKRKKKRNRR